MGEIVGAAIVSHVPPIVMNDADLADLYGPAGTTLIDGLHRLRRERLDALDVDTIVVFDTHWFTTVEHIISSHARRSGIYTSEELPRGMCQMPYDLVGDPLRVGQVLINYANNAVKFTETGEIDGSMVDASASGIGLILPNAVQNKSRVSTRI